jgi:fumarate hydratase class II
MLPVIARNLLESIRLIANCARLLADRCIDGATADVDRCRTYAESSPSIVTPLNRFIGYENAAKVAKKAVTEGMTVRQAVVDLGFVGDGDGQVTEAQLDEALDVLAMAYPHGR